MGGQFKSFLVNVGVRIMSVFPIRNVIVFESSPDFACNSYPLYEKLKADKAFSSKYRFMWLVSEGALPVSGINKKDLIYDAPKTPLRILKNLYYKSVAKCFVMSNRVKRKARKDQLFIFLCHGSKTKRTKSLYEIGDAVDHVACQSHFFDDVICREYNVKKEQLVYLGYPRCDALYQDHKNLRKEFGINDDEKLVIWLPTYRKHKSAKTGEHMSAGIPLLRDPKSVIKLEKALRDNKVKILLKPHPAEDLSFIGSLGADNFSIISDAVLAEHGTKLYEILAASDAMISDYSSVFYDYLLCDRPIGLTSDDEDAYKNSRGFALDLDALYDKASERLKDIEDLCAFVKDISLGKDVHVQGRREIRDITNIYNDGESADRWAGFIADRLM